ncbi:amino acid transporter [Actinobacteria bacterium YIM 96077]|uniref:Amino acid transporter n=1 Tax=Phytoactinopolyspora halophila TaxID=1981511 RepID=A0A329QD99_9ACTN|nr:LysE/ArgO family amino acid transporter [Phytoactinopolyspora halophila]AYY14026.1 amino acid transporter [Actinobacteria bacterium YIM 96077]RAW10277.1 amino acid transporter [Phytoactinopolyspora halophila]
MSLPLPAPTATVAVGFVTGLSLIIAIGAQNAFVLRQGIRREHVLVVILLCSAADALLITAGVAGLGAVVTAHPAAVEITRYAGAAFVLGYAVLATRRALRPNVLTVDDAPPVAARRRAAIMACLGFTVLNPHVYLDTMILLGSLANQHGSGRWLYGIGATLASFVWFFALGYGARTLRRFFARPRSWQILDALIAAVMFVIGVTLLTR